PEAEATSEPEAEAISEPETEATSEPEAEPTSEPEAEATSQPEAEPTSEPETEATSEPEAEPTSEPETEASSEPEAEATTEPEAEATPEPEAEATSEPEAEATSEPETEASSEPEAEATTEPEAEATSEPEAEATSEPEAEATPEPEAEATSEPEAEATSEPEAEATSEPEAEATTEPEAEPTSEPEAEATSEPEAEATSEPEAEATSEPEAEATSEPEAEATSEPEAEVTSVPEAEPTSEPEAEATSEPEAEATSQPEAEATSEPEAEATSEPEAEATSEPEAEATSEPEAEPTSEPETEATSEPEAEATTEPEAEATSEPEAEATSEPEAEATSEPEAEATTEPEAEATSEPEADSAATSEAESATEPETRPSAVEIILPPVSLMVFVIFVAGLLSLLISSRCKTSPLGVEKRRRQRDTSRDVTDFSYDDISVTSVSTENESCHGEFLSNFDLEVLESLHSSYNKPLELLKISFPALLSLGLCPFTLYLYEPFTTFLWPPDEYETPPDINDAIACFLAPAGLVYATSFGFAFQQALNKQRDILDKLTTEISMIDQIATFSSKLKLINSNIRREIYYAVKCEAVFMVLQILNREQTSYHYKPNVDVKVKIWSIVDLLREVDASDNNIVNKTMCDKIMAHIIKLNSICSDRIGILHTKIHPVKWAFLETLGFFSFIGILLLRALSYRLELTMCIITVFSISMLCYVVSDLDSPFSGFFRVDLSILGVVVQRLERMYYEERTMAEGTIITVSTFVDDSELKDLRSMKSNKPLF
ncbi:immunoglobulin A1 protease autotransporter-like, partial [Pecten maximus]|uniref:immunoglobulin A1 protease autotransporter-like n=1 Tax=Pecten maximus TaxID=6579 RepID=UPI0014587CD9